MDPAPAPTVSPLDACLAALMGLAVAAVLWIVACEATTICWNPPRLASAYALARGLDLYPGLASGAQLGWNYGPGFPVAFLPVTLIATPVAAVLAAAGWNALLILGAVAFTLRSGGLTGGRLAAATALAALLLLTCSPTLAWFIHVHVDGPAVACCLIAIAAAWRFDVSGRARWVHLSTLAGAAAVWTKQTDAVILLAIVAWWLARRRWSALGPWVGWGAVYGAALSLLVLWRFGFADVWLYTVDIHRANPWARAELWFTGVLAPLFGELLPWFAVATTAGLLRRLGGGATPGAGLWGLLGWCALVQTPLGVVAKLKLGGGLNTAHGLACAAVAVAGWAAQRHALAAAMPAFRAKARALGAAASLGLVALAAAAMWGRPTKPDPYLDELLRYAQAHRGAVYLPWNPLVTILSDGKIYPFDDALMVYDAVGRPVPAEAVRAAVPAQALIVYDRMSPTNFALRYFPGRPFVTGHGDPGRPGTRGVVPAEK